MLLYVCIAKALESSHVSHYRSQLSHVFGVLPHAPPRQVIHTTHNTPGVGFRLRGQDCGDAPASNPPSRLNFEGP